MERIKVKSSAIASIGYDAEKEILEIEFNTKEVYKYLKVKIEVYNELIKAESVGKHFFKNIAKKYTYVHV